MMYFFLLVLLGLVFVFFNFSTIPSKSDTSDFGKILYSWHSPNNLWFTTKLFIVLMSLVFTLPIFLNIQTKDAFQWKKDIQFYLDYMQNIRVTVRTIEELNFLEMMFIAIFVTIVLFLVNSRFHYVITEKGIYYSVLDGFKFVAFYRWDEIVCYDIDSEKHLLLLWLRPPIYKPDWVVKISPKKKNEINDILKKYCVLYSVRKNDFYEKNHPISLTKTK